MALSHDELCHIFSWMPAKAVCKFKCVAKSFPELLEETYFTMKQALNSLLKEDPCFFIQPDYYSQKFINKIEIHSLLGEDESSGVPKDFLQLLANSAIILASSNGLILCKSKEKSPVELFICNPATKSWLQIPTPDSVQDAPDAYVNIALFECNQGSDVDDYKILLIENPADWSSDFGCKVYLPKEGVWKTMERSFFTGSRNMRFDMPVFHNGSVHIISDCFPSFNRESKYFRPYIMAYELESGVTTMLRVPKEARRGSHDPSCDMGIFKWGKVTSSDQSICLVRLRKFVFTIWVLTDYKSWAWRNILKVRVRAILGLREQNPIITGFTVMNGDSLVFATDEKKVYSYGLSYEKYMMLEEISEHRCESRILRFTSYSNTLRPCGSGSTTLSCVHAATTSTPRKYEYDIATMPILEDSRLISLEERPHSLFLHMFGFVFLVLFMGWSIFGLNVHGL